MQGTSYTDEGATASDNVDGSVSVQTSGEVNTAVVGSYFITYSATDAANNTTSTTREVIVQPSFTVSVSVTGLSNGSLVIELNSAETKTVIQDGQYEFLTRLAENDSYIWLILLIGQTLKLGVHVH